MLLKVYPYAACLKYRYSDSWTRRERRKEAVRLGLIKRACERTRRQGRSGWSRGE